MALQPPPHEGDFDAYVPLFSEKPGELAEILSPYFGDPSTLVQRARDRAAGARERRRQREVEKRRHAQDLQRSKFTLKVETGSGRRKSKPPEKWGTQELVDYFEEMWLRRTLGKESLGWKPLNRRALGASIKRWLAQGVRPEHVKAMMDVFASPTTHPVPANRFPWAIFVGRFEVLYTQGKNLLQSQRYQRQHQEAQAELVGLGALPEPKWDDLFRMTQERELYPASHPANRRTAHPSNPAWTPHEGE